MYTPITFEFLKSVDGKGPEQKVYRTKKIEKAYDDYKNNMLSQNKTLKQIMVDKFLLDNDEFDKHILIEKNKFPYNLEKGLTQLIVWVNPMYDIDESYIREVVEKHIQKNNYSLYKQDPQYGSIPDMVHFHLFINKDTDYKSVLGKH